MGGEKITCRYTGKKSCCGSRFKKDGAFAAAADLERREHALRQQIREVGASAVAALLNPMRLTVQTSRFALGILDVQRSLQGNSKDDALVDSVGTSAKLGSTAAAAMLLNPMYLEQSHSPEIGFPRSYMSV